jgi:steroid 5-alpha reductase family enzyme
LGIKDLLGVGIWAGGLGLEILADSRGSSPTRKGLRVELMRLEKSSWRADKDAKKHDEKFITSGLWGYSRHPKYVSSLLTLMLIL